MPTPEVQLIEQDQDGNPCHKYLLDGKEIPGLSYILETQGFTRYGRVRDSIMEAARERGQAADEACNLFDEDYPLIEKFDVALSYWEDGSLSERLDEWTRSRLMGWIKFRRDFRFNVLLCQKCVSHELNGMLYAFKLDVYGEMEDAKRGKVSVIVERKATAECEPSHAIQTAAQSLPFKNGTGPERWGVYLRENDYKPEEFKERSDERIFGAALACTWWRWSKGIR